VIVVSNTSPILNLMAVGELGLLRQLYGTVLVPEAVRDELLAFDSDLADAATFHEQSWISVRSVTDRPLVNLLRLELDSGEAEAVALAAETQADLLLLDERRGRNVASRLGLRYMGLVGCLIQGKQQNLLSTIKPTLDNLVRQAGFWLDSELYERVLREVKE